MKKLYLKGWAAACTIILIGTFFTGCGIFDVNSTPVKDGIINTSKYTKLSMCLLTPTGVNPHGDLHNFLEGLNMDIKDSINTNTEISFIPSEEAYIEYPKIFNSGENFDIYYVSSKASPGYFELASKELLKPVDDLLPIYGERIWEGIDSEKWEDVKYQGKTYGIPLGGENYRLNGLIYRGDISHEEGLESIETIESMGNYLDTMLGENNDLPPIFMTEEDALGLYDMLIDFHKDWTPAPGLNGPTLYLVKCSDKNLNNIIHPAFSKEFMEFAITTREWADRGYWGDDVLSLKEEEGDNTGEGTNTLRFGDYNSFFDLTCNLTSAAKDKGDPKFIPFFEGLGKGVIKSGSSKKALAINEKSKNSERALMLLDFLLGDESYKWLFDCDYEGDKPDYEALDTLYDLGENAIKDPYDKFFFDNRGLEDELEKVLTINKKYGIPILLGKAGEPRKAVERYRDELMKAGIQRIIIGLKDQLKDFEVDR